MVMLERERTNGGRKKRRIKRETKETKASERKEKGKVKEKGTRTEKEMEWRLRVEIGGEKREIMDQPRSKWQCKKKKK